ncbi:hypothetical protein D9611_005836 [Ephemerocybe angulata]|uniref:MYND-type domain-containing protein n=1 Tax=Ephemerocybe angulata TaxID=980116 RepID=A0A8H5FLK2_9AGAR|nr:hypothetical protein D9611_014860 [Tulosesus angulatus]KAF5341097.1 hypothetical protein D9611_005836 [Tulosesus angulatus]
MPHIDTQTRSFELLLKAIEKGSIPDFHRLQTEWPDNVDLAKRALSAIFRHLKNLPPPATTYKEYAVPFALLHVAFNCLDGVMNQLRRKLEAYVEELYEVIQEHLHDLVVCIDFLRLLPLQSDGKGSIWHDPLYGSSRAARMIASLLWKGRTRHLEGDYDSLTRIVCISLDNWMAWSAMDGAKLALHKMHAASRLPIFTALWSCIGNQMTREILTVKIAQFDKASHKKLAFCFSNRCRQWEDFSEGPKSESLRIEFIGTINLALILSNNLDFRRALARTGFHAQVLKFGLQFPHSSNQDSPSPSMSIQVVHELLTFRRLDPEENAHAIPGLLRAGLLNVIAEEMLQFAKSPKVPFPLWKLQSPLHCLYHLGYHPNTANELRLAISALPKTLEEAIQKDPLSGPHWRLFIQNILVFAEGYRPSPDQNGAKGVVLCDNIEHHKTHANDDSNGLAVSQCSWCQTTVYCSVECQQRDWKELHRKECVDARVHRIDRQLEGTWISHKIRATLFRLSEYLLKSSMRETAKKVRYLDYTAYPAYPQYFDPHELIVALVSQGIQSVFNEERFSALFKQLVDDTSDSLRLVATKAVFGPYFLITLACFHVAVVPNATEDPNPKIELRLVIPMEDSVAQFVVLGEVGHEVGSEWDFGYDGGSLDDFEEGDTEEEEEGRDEDSEEDGRMTSEEDAECGGTDPKEKIFYQITLRNGFSWVREVAESQGLEGPL